MKKLLLGMAPMAGITDTIFRKIVKEFGADITFTEMISSRGICHNDSRTKKYLYYDSVEQPIICQLFGNTPSHMGEAAKYVESLGFSGININMGCPMQKIIKNGDGSALMKDIPLASAICESVANSVSIPVSVKFRSGWDKDSVNAVSFASAMEQSGASYLIIHPRTREQMYSGFADMSIAAEIKRNVKISVIYSGDICDYDSFAKASKTTACDAFLIGRAALGNPWIFKEIICGEKGLPYSKPSVNEVLDTAYCHVYMMCEYYGENVGIRNSRKLVNWYIKGMENSAEYRNRISRITTLSQLKELLREYKASI